ncbi:hypothetical protein RFI_20812, partial [Reticulomyxa filosa]
LEREDVDAGPKEPQKVENVVAFVNQLNMDELLAQQLTGENLPLVDASYLPPETTNTSVDKEYSIVMESAANSNSNENAETEQDKDTDLILAMQLEIKETNQILNTMTNEIMLTMAMMTMRMRLLLLMKMQMAKNKEPIEYQDK